MERAQLIEDMLRSKLAASHVEIVDDSARHAGHLGAQGGGGHFQIIVVSPRFEGLTRVAAQRLVYEALGEMMRSEIHALQMRTFTPEAWQETQKRQAGG